MEEGDNTSSDLPDCRRAATAAAAHSPSSSPAAPGTGVFLLFGTPPGLELGLDLRQWTAGPRFRGVRGVAPGPHLLQWDAPPAGTFLWLRPAQTMVLRWDPRLEEFRGPAADGDVAEDDARLALAVEGGEFDAHLGPHEHDARWPLLTDFLSQRVLDTLRPRSGGALSLLYDECDAADVRGLDAGRGGGASLPDDAARLAHRPRFLALAEVRAPPRGLTPAEVTRWHMDRSGALRRALCERTADDLLGEVQYSFLVFFLLSSFDALQQWKQLVDLLCSCDAEMGAEPALFARFAAVLAGQLECLPRDFFTDPLSGGNFLGSALGRFVAAAAECDAPGVRLAARELRRTATERLDGVEAFFEEEEGDAECRPVVVETDGGGGSR